jgi:hypothetical protein
MRTATGKEVTSAAEDTFIRVTSLRLQFPQLPGLNPIEMVWDELDCRVKEKQPTSAQHMWELLQD